MLTPSIWRSTWGELRVRLRPCEQVGTEAGPQKTPEVQVWICNLGP